MNASARALFTPLLLAAAGLTGCSVLPEAPPQDIYRLPASTLSPATGTPLDISLRVNRPATSDVLRGARIAVVRDGNHVSVYGGARWASPVPALWRDQLLDAFHSDGRIRWTSGDHEGARADWELSGMLRAFQSEYRAGEPEVVLRFDANLIATGSQRIAASRRFTVQEDVEGTAVPEVVEAFGRATDEMARQLIQWTVSELQRTHHTPP